MKTKGMRIITEFVSMVKKMIVNLLSKTDKVDGVYVIYQDGTCALYEEGMNISGPVQYVGLKLGSKSIAIALKDEYDEVTSLINKINTTPYNGYKDNKIDALSDWNGKENTDYLKERGLNPKIKLNEGEYIPALGELLFINLFIKKINEALETVGGQVLDGYHWTSTEYSVVAGWFLLIGNGRLRPLMMVYPHSVRAVATFNPTKLLKTK